MPSARGLVILEVMNDQRDDGLGTFLRSRRAKLKPSDVGLRDHGGFRRVPGLRREEVAHAAGISVAYYIRMEQGTANRISDEVIDSLARTLGLDAPERAHLRNLANSRSRGSTPEPLPDERMRALQAMLDSMGSVAYITGPRGDILAWNRTAAALFGSWEDVPAEQRNWGRFLFVSPGYHDVWVDWAGKAFDFVGYLRGYAGRNPDDPQLWALVDELGSGSAVFRDMWASQDVKDSAYGRKKLRHPDVGEFELLFESVRLPADPEWSLISLHAPSGSHSERAVRSLLAHSESLIVSR